MTSMTDATGDAGHPDVAEISDLAEGLLGPARSGEVRSHLDACVLCADVRSSLEEIRGLLGTLPGPSRMPADVAGRIDAALAAEALLGTMEPGTGEAPQAEPTEIPDADVSRETSRDVSRETVAAETGPPEPSTAPAPPSSSSGAPGLGESARSGRPEGRGRAATGPGRKSGSRTGRRRLLLSSVLAAAAIGLGAVLVPTLSDAGSSGGEDSAASADAGPVYSDEALQEQVSALLSGTEAGGGRQEKEGPGAGAAEKDEEASLGIQSSPGTPELNEPMMGTGPEVPPCVERAIARPEPALALERGRYQGTDAFLVVLPDHRDSARVTAYLVDAACVGAGNEPGDVLLTRTYPRS